jgi:hypothetical protein
MFAFKQLEKINIIISALNEIVFSRLCINEFIRKSREKNYEIEFI